MAQEKPRCVLCGQEIGFFSRASLPLYNTTQIVCTACQYLYEGGSQEEREGLKKKMLQSPHLADRERLQTLMKWKREEEARRQESEHQDVLQAARRERSTLCCTKLMKLRGTTRFPLYQEGNTQSVTELSVYECQVCGRFKFFRPVEQMDQE